MSYSQELRQRAARFQTAFETVLALGGLAAAVAGIAGVGALIAAILLSIN